MTRGGASRRTYVIVFIALLLLTALTTGIARLDLGRFNLPVALSIATAKAFLVALFFMHLAQARHRTQLIAGAGLFWLLLLISLTLADVATREPPPGPIPSDTLYSTAAK